MHMLCMHCDYICHQIKAICECSPESRAPNVPLLECAGPSNERAAHSNQGTLGALDSGRTLTYCFYLMTYVITMHAQHVHRSAASNKCS